jgi:hypothetical protein
MPYLLVEVSGDPARVDVVRHDDANPAAVKLLGVCANLAAVRLLCCQMESPPVGAVKPPFDADGWWSDPDLEDEPDDVLPSAFVSESPVAPPGNPPSAESGGGG